jgi:hypothetical protein
MTAFPDSPKLQKGHILAIDQDTRQETVIGFQYNPDTLTRKLTAQSVTAGSGADRAEALRLIGPPQETISLEIEIDATDQLEVVRSGNDTVVQLGINPALAALEILLYPQYRQVSQNEDNAAKGMIEIIPFEAALTLFVWGKNRTVPVRLTSLNVTEEAFDPDLNPVRAKVNLEMQVLTYFDLGFNNRGGQTFITYHQNKEQWAKKNKNVS